MFVPYSWLFIVVTVIALLFVGCQAETGAASSVSKEGQVQLSGVPAWSQEAIWYQIFVERFRNGDPTNDPTLEGHRAFLSL